MLEISPINKRSLSAASLSTTNVLSPNFQVVRSQVFEFDRGATIPQTAANFWLITSGAVKTLTWDETGKVSILGYWGVGDVVGLPFSTVNPYEAECINEVKARLISDRYSPNFVREITHCLHQTDELLRIVRIERMYHRLWQLLLWLSRKFGKATIQGTAIDLRITHQELADLLGSTRVTVTRLLKQMETEQKILRPGRFTLVLKTD